MTKKLTSIPILVLFIFTLSCRSLFEIQQNIEDNRLFTTATQYPSKTDTETPITPTLTNTKNPPSATSTKIPTLTHTAKPTNTATLRPTPSSEQEQVFKELWSAINENYLYPDFNGLDWNEIHNEFEERIKLGLTKKEFYEAMHELVYALGDDHSAFFDPGEVAEADAELNGEYSYVGIGVLGIVQEGKEHLSVISTFPNSPAEKAGILPHDRVIEVNGEPVVDKNGIRYELLSGEVESVIKIKLLTPNNEVKEISLKREELSGNLPVPYFKSETNAGKSIGYIMLTSFRYTSIYENVLSILSELSSDKQLDGLIIDNRFNRGGSSDVLTNVLSLFINGNAGYFIQQKAERLFTIKGENFFGSQYVPLVILIGPDTASFGEIFSGVLKDLDRAYLIGENSEGNVEVLHIFDFSDGSRAWIAKETFQPLFNPDLNWENIGVTPHLILESDWDEFTTQNDPLINSALQYFDGID